MPQKEKINVKTCAKIFNKTDQNLSFQFWTSNPKSRLHRHEFFELFLAIDGDIQHVVNGESSVLEKGTLCLLRPNDTHKFIPYQNKKTVQFDIKLTIPLFELLATTVNPTLYQRIWAAEKPISYRLREYELNYFFKAIDHAHISPSNSLDESMLPLMRTLATMFLYYIDASVQQSSSERPKWFTQFLYTISSPDSFQKPLSEIYKLSPYSQTRLNTYFNKYMGMTMVQFIVKQKINYACKLLRITDHTVIKIATMAGFGTLGYFNTLFKNMVGIPPTQYRKQFSSHSIEN